MLDTYLKWFVAHERLMLVLAVLAFGTYGWNKWLDKSTMDAHAQASVAEQSALLAKQAADKQAVLMQQQIDQFNQREAAREQEMASIVAAVASRDAASSKRIADVQAPKTPPQAVTDLNAAYPKLPVPLVPTDTGANVSTADLQQFTATKIGADTCQADLADTKTELATDEKSLSDATGVIKGLQTQVADDKVAATTAQTAFDKEKKDLTAQARKSKFKIFWMGVVVGFLGREAIKH